VEGRLSRIRWRRAWALLWLLVAAGCGQVAGAPDSGGGDPETDGGERAADAGPGDCDPADPFVSIRRIAALSSPTTECCVGFDGSGNAFYSYGTGDGRDLFTAVPGNAPDTYVEFTMLQAVSDPASGEWNPTVSSDGDRLYFMRAWLPAPDAGAVAGTWVSERDAISGDFAAPTQVVVDGDPLGNFDPHLADDDETLYFARGGPPDIYRASPESIDLFTGAVRLAGLESDGWDNHPVSGPDQGVIYWASDRQASGAQGGADIWMATWDAENDRYVEVHAVTELNSPDLEIPTWASPDGCELYFTTNRDEANPGGPAADEDVYVANRRAR
jgi:WD40 repeat protein